jgi:hypothetical protein
VHPGIFSAYQFGPASHRGFLTANLGNIGIAGGSVDLIWKVADFSRCHRWFTSLAAA